MARETIEAPMPGKVLKVLVSPGDNVHENDKVCVIESMKMENPIRARIGGRVVAVDIREGVTVSAGQVLVVLES